MAKKAISRRIAPTSGTCRRPNGALGGTLCRSRRVKQRGKAKTRAKEAKERVKARISSSTKVTAKVSVLWSTQTRSRTGRRNLGAQKMSHGIRSEPCSRSRRLPVEKVPIKIMHKKNTAVKRQPPMKDVSKMHTIAEDTHEVEKDETNMDKEKKEVENMFAEKAWTVKMSRNRMRSRKAAKVLRSDRCDCCTSQSSRIIS